MKAVVYHGPGKRAWEEVPDATILEPTDVIARVDTTTICGTDLHILKGDVPEVEEGRILGHEAIGTITEVGSAVTDLKVGDRIIIPAVTNCGKCSYCKDNKPSHCQTVGGVGWIFGYMIDGTQAEYVRIPYAETSVHMVPEGLTANLCGAGRVITVDMDDNRMNKALELGATDKVNAADPDFIEKIKALSPDGLGVDVAIEAVGVPQTFETCTKIVRPYGNIANAGVHGKPVELPINTMWISNVNINMGLVNCNTVGNLLNMVRSGRLNAKAMATHYFTFDQFEEAYDLFANAAEHNAVKVVISREPIKK